MSNSLRKSSICYAIIFGTILGLLSFTILTVWVNLLSALLAMSGIVFYMLIYTHWLKRHTTKILSLVVRLVQFLL